MTIDEKENYSHKLYAFLILENVIVTALMLISVWLGVTYTDVFFRDIFTFYVFVWAFKIIFLPSMYVGLIPMIWFDIFKN